MKINLSLQRMLQQLEENEADAVCQDAQAALLSHLEAIRNPPDDPYNLDAMLRKGIYGEVSVEEWLLFKFSSPCVGFEMPLANAIAAYRRIRFDCPRQYALRISLAARVEWIEAKVDWKYDRAQLWRPLLLAAAAHDALARDRLLQHWEKREPKTCHGAEAVICMGIEAVIKNDSQQLAAAIEETSKRKGVAYIQGIHQVLAALLADDTAQLADGLEKMLKQFKKYMMGEASMALIDPFAHGLYELARSYAPQSVESFDAARKLPWDTQYAAWIATVEDIGPELTKLELPDFLERALIQMKDMDWAPDNRLRDRRV